MITATGPGSRAVPQHSSQMPKPAIPTAAGQRPSRAGYASGSGGSVTRLISEPAARPIARHGLIRRHTSPTSRLANGTPTHSAT